MMDAESRFDYLEGRVEEQSRNWERLFADIMDAVGRNLDGKIHSVDQKLDRRFDTLQQEISKQFRWTIGVMVTLTIGVITAVLTR